MKTIQPVYDTIRDTLQENNTTLFIKVGKHTVRVQDVYKNPKGTFIRSSLGETKVDLFTELYID